MDLLDVTSICRLLLVECRDDMVTWVPLSVAKEIAPQTEAHPDRACTSVVRLLKVGIVRRLSMRLIFLYRLHAWSSQEWFG